MVFVPYIALTDDGLVVRNGVSLRTIPYLNIVRVKPGYYGILVVTNDRRAFNVWGVQKPNYATWFHKQVRADIVTQAITDRVAAERADRRTTDTH